MYESFYGLRELPFTLTPDPRFLWLSETHREGLAVLEYGITRRKGFLLLTGEVGAGKTTLLRAVLDRLPGDVDVALVMNTTDLRPVDLFKFIAAEFRIGGRFETKADYVIALNRFLLGRLHQGMNTVVIIDEAQNLDDALIEEVRLLSNLETDTEKLIQIVLTGQPELLRRLSKPSLRQLRQRIAIEHHVDPLTSQEVEPYLAHRVATAGGRYEEVFKPGVASTFYWFSAGCPRLISLLADRVLLAGYAKQVRPIPHELVQLKAKELIATRAAGLSGEFETER